MDQFRVLERQIRSHKQRFNSLRTIVTLGKSIKLYFNYLNEEERIKILEVYKRGDLQEIKDMVKKKERIHG